MIVHTYNPSAQKAKGEGSVERQSQLYDVLKASLGLCSLSLSPLVKRICYSDQSYIVSYSVDLDFSNVTFLADALLDYPF